MNSLRRQYCVLLHRLHAIPTSTGAAAAFAISPENGTQHGTTTAATLLLHHCCARTFSLSAHCARASHYDVLGISPKATQADVKSAYYRLSMIHHPDKSHGGADSAEKFRAITAAYEVLSNYRLRRLYDKGIGGHTPGVARSAYGHHAPDPTVEDVEPDDAQTKFYKRHMTRTETPHSSGRTPIYNFDAWAAAHYGQSFERRQAAQTRYKTKQERVQVEEHGFQSELVVFSVLLGFVMMLFTSIQISAGDEDSVITKETSVCGEGKQDS